MAIVRFKDLCIDANNPEVLGRFWAQGLGVEFHRQDGGDAYLAGHTPQHTVWVNGVPETKSVKHRLHLDVNAASVDEFVGLGASIVDQASFPWTVMTDPEGGEFCVFARDETPAHALHALVIDCASTEASKAIATWWASAFDATAVHDPRGISSVVDIPDAPFASLDFIPVPEPKSVKNRLHIDVTADEVAVVIAHGATVIRPGDEQIAWTVCADPDGNEFCVFTRA